MSSFNMDNLTMECFTNKKTYHKYLAKKDPNLFQQNEIFNNELIENHAAIIELISECIHNPSSMTQHKMRDSFNQFMIECLDVISSTYTTSKHQPHIEVQANREEMAKDEDILFSQCEDLGTAPKNSIEYWKMENVFKH